jgi:hypothetical protein
MSDKKGALIAKYNQESKEQKVAKILKSKKY